MKKLLLLASTFFVVALYAQNSYTPAVKLEAGKKYIVSTAMVNNSTAEAMGQQMESTTNMTTVEALQVKNVLGNNGFILDNTTTQIVVNASAMGQEMSYDSDKKEDRESNLGEAFNSRLGKVSTFTINNYGQVTDEAEKAALPGKAAASNDPALAMIAALQGGTNSPAVSLFKTNATLKIGESFIDSATSGDTKKSIVYTLQSVTQETATFSFKGSMQLNITSEMNGMQFTTNNEIKINGEMLVKVNTGLLYKKLTNMDVAGTAQVMGMNIPINGKVNIITTVEPVN
jgi:hypothetical protein